MRSNLEATGSLWPHSSTLHMFTESGKDTQCGSTGNLWRGFVCE